MFFVLSKVLWVAAAPTNLLLGLALAGAGAALAGRRWGPRLALGAVATLLLCGVLPVGRLMLRESEAAAAAAGFGRAELAATLAGVPLYRACGWQEIAPLLSDPVDGVRVPLVRMGKRLRPDAGGAEGRGSSG